MKLEADVMVSTKMLDSFLGLETRQVSLPLLLVSFSVAGAMAPACVLADLTPPGFYQDVLNSASVNGAITGNAIFQTCATGANASGASNNQAFQADCNRVVGGAIADPVGSTQALNMLAADQIGAQNSAASRAAGLGVAVVQTRLQHIRLASGLPVYQPSVLLANNHVFQNQTGGGASGDAAFDRFGAFLSLGYVNGKEDQTAFQPGADMDRRSVSGGIDYRFKDNLFGGVVLRYADADVAFDNSRGDMSGDEWGLALYGTYFRPEGLFFDGLIGYGNDDYTLRRRIGYSVDSEVADQSATSSPQSSVVNVNLGVGYTMSRDAWTITPALRLNFLRNKVDAYRESMSSPIDSTTVGSSMALGIDAQTYTSLVSDFGIQISRAINLSNQVLVPQLRVSWLHEFKNDQAQVGAYFINDINKQPFFVLTNQPDRDYVDLGIAVSAQFAQGRSAFISYDTLLGYQGVSYDSVNIGMRFEF